MRHAATRFTNAAFAQTTLLSESPGTSGEIDYLDEVGLIKAYLDAFNALFDGQPFGKVDQCPERAWQRSPNGERIGAIDDEVEQDE